ncbi:DUF3703 domain-containing protein [Streptosporangium sp. NBC_01810]|uniref:DUF3703 domain-containing protein n=1 Tax=Streptosporangium sp. NBC_01810 TaxID=2975951 RepID=UPI002DDA6DED|nr:DUF3703 domain-containing protein [Streptosporangium sp. NBC_01810]WSA28680.1 DUF3703 domain-containing protein [Streptosporangium sp. NBC_01810]
MRAALHTGAPSACRPHPQSHHPEITMSRPMSAAVRAAYRDEISAARTASAPGARWRHLERAHILSQPWPWPHTRNHLAMFVLAVRQRDRREVLGQVVRIIVAAPGSVLGRYPEGNTGRAAAKLTQPMPVPPDLAALLTT